ncbi:serine carboxypeptidase S28-domain-containing protein [Armillaria nabsnona]|nr:serine carboxypeptidase S28-domain-containing protein [Armillaria nabsnona]
MAPSSLAKALATVLIYTSLCNALGALPALGPQGINLWKLQQQQQAVKLSLTVQNPSNSGVEEFPVQWFQQPLDHFDSSSGHTFGQRYWVNKRHYEPGTGGPVIVLDGGETSGEDRIPFLDTGIVEILARATGGVGVVLEHRYYGESIAVENLTTDSLRWLNNEQAAADSANFMANVKFDGIDEELTAPGTPWIYYGGSYAGARAAHMKILYPELVFGAIASSGVTHATIVYWEYWDTIRTAAEPKCSYHIQKSIETIDKLLSTKRLSRPLKALFGLPDLQHDEDFVSLLETPLGYWQAKCWDPAFGSNVFDEFCDALNKPPLGFLAADVADLEFEDPARMISLPGGLSLDFSIVNYANWTKQNVVSTCPEGSTQEECFGTFNDSQYAATTLDQTWRLWQFQVCTQWGFFMPAPPPDYPRIVSNLITLDYESKICKQAYAPGEYFTVPPLPNVTAVNVLGDFDIAADRLAIIDGEVDPWRPATPHSQYAMDRDDTVLRPFKLIPHAVHHYDEYGLKNLSDEPPEIRKIHGEMIAFVMEWLKDWTPPKEGQ